jgi:N-acetylneuraminic acid mutarotase
MILQPYTAAVPAEYIKEIVRPYNATPGFGWVNQDSPINKTHTPLDITPNSRNLNCAGIEPQLNILLHLKYPTCISQVLLPWSTAAPSPIKRYEAANAVVNNKLYVLGGYFNSSIQATRRSDVYNPATNTWRQLRNMPLPITHAGVAVDGNTIYMAGGFVGDHPGSITAKVFKYNVTSNMWRQGPSLPAPRGAGGLVRLGRELHFFGGLNHYKKADKGNHWVLNLDRGKSWVSKAPLPNPRNHFGYTVNGGKIYVIGGLHLSNTQRNNQSDVHAYNPLTNAWTKVASLPFARSHIHTSTFVRNGRIVIVGGLANGSLDTKTLANVTEYNPKLNKWVALSPLPKPRQAAAAKLINNQIVVTTGSASGPNPQTTTWLGGG